MITEYWNWLKGRGQRVAVLAGLPIFYIALRGRLQEDLAAIAPICAGVLCESLFPQYFSAIGLTTSGFGAARLQALLWNGLSLALAFVALVGLLKATRFSSAHDLIGTVALFLFGAFYAATLENVKLFGRIP